MGKHNHFTKELLENYAERGLSYQEIADIHGCYFGTVAKNFKKFDVQLRTIHSKSLIGEKFNLLTVINYANPDNPKQEYLCSCDCGGEKVAFAYELKGNHVKSCGCLRNDGINYYTTINNTLIGNKFNLLTVVDFVNPDNPRQEYLCQCDCGGSRTALAWQLTNETIKSCGCLLKTSPNKGNMDDSKARGHIGEKFNRLTIIDIVKNTGIQQGYFMKCLCDCGNTVEKVKYSDMYNNLVMSCGCYARESSSKRSISQLKKESWKYGYKWYFYNDKNEKFRCRSKYEVLFANWLTKNNIDFKYESRILKVSESQRYLPDFYLIDEDKYVELKGYLREDSRQTEAIIILKNYYNIEVLQWKEIVHRCNLPYASEGSYLYQAKKLGMKVEDYLAEKLYFK